jgi:hypothetical protein
VKKAFVTLMAIFLLVSSVGFTIYAHYCNDELKETSVIAKTKSCCDEEATTPVKESKEEMSCCAEKDVHIVIKDHFVKSESSFSVLTQPVLFINTYSLMQFSVYQSPVTNHQVFIFEGDNCDPPDLNLLHSVFRI